MSRGELREATDYLRSVGAGGRYVCYGGYGESERQRIFFLPDYITDAECYDDILPYIEKEPIEALLISGSGYRKLTHRDLLGSLLALGIERDVIGDVAFLDGDGFSAVVFCDALISEFIMLELCRVANDAVKVKRTVVDKDFAPHRSFLHISDTVASSRIDSVVAALCSLSRDKARAAVVSELVEVDFAVESRPDHQISAPCIVSVRGYGRFKVNSVSDMTRKGRLRLDADKYL
jgi:RNA-binding protein YlmH